ncbi:MAG: hydrolase TatD [Spirochaeta sp. LUC14_002_19_P3]|nr:MAG: hydrolase TatD [Spirochaeta sp. LUC14_002_19_P3]
MKYFDTHAHIGLIHDDPIEQLIITQEAKQAGVMKILSITNNLQDFFEVHHNLSTASNVVFSIGVSPSEVQYPGQDWQQKIVNGIKMDKIVAIGETGLDYYRKFGNKSIQVELFIAQLELAESLGLPVVIHNRNAGHDIKEILKSKLPSRGGVLHCFSEDVDFAAEMISRHDNLYFSFAGNLTYKNARNLHDTVRYLPMERIVIESESPFMVPAEYRGKRNKPIFLPSTAAFVAELREEDEEEVAQALWHNSCTLFGIDSDE